MQLPANFSSAACRARELWRETLSPLLGAPVWHSVLASMRAHPLLLVPPGSPARALRPDVGVGVGEEVLASLPDLGAPRLLALEETEAKVHLVAGATAAPVCQQLHSSPAALSSHAPAIFLFAGSFLRFVRILAPALDKGDSDELVRTFLSQNGVFAFTVSLHLIFCI